MSDFSCLLKLAWPPFAEYSIQSDPSVDWEYVTCALVMRPLFLADGTPTTPPPPPNVPIKPPKHKQAVNAVAFCVGPKLERSYATERRRVQSKRRSNARGLRPFSIRLRLASLHNRN